MTEIELQDYQADFKQDNQEKEEKEALKRSTVRQRRYAVDEIAAWFDYHDKVLDTEDFYHSTDNLKAFFDQTNLHQSKVACVRAFLNYIERKLPTEEGDRLHDIQERIKYSRLAGGSSRKGKSKTKQLQEKILDDEELGAVYFVATEFEELVVRAMLDMGTRPGELAALTAEDFNWNYQQGGIGATVKIDKTYSQGVGVQDSPKTEDSNRTVNLQQPTVELLQDYIEQHEIGDDELIFEDYRTVYNALKDVFTFACVKLGGNYITDVTPHMLRHNTATRLIVEEDYPKEKVQQYLGHSSVQITEIYEHLDENRVVDIHA